jgi:hypothetical protein
MRMRLVAALSALLAAGCEPVGMDEYIAGEVPITAERQLIEAARSCGAPGVRSARQFASEPGQTAILISEAGLSNIAAQCIGELFDKVAGQ